MKRIIVFIKRYWIFIILATIVSVLLAIRISQRGQPSPSEVQPTPFPQITLSPPKITGINLPRETKTTFSEFSFPPRLKIYQGQEKELSPNQAIKIARYFGFSESPQKTEDIFLGTFYIWASETDSLSIALNSPKIGYSRSSQTSNGGSFPSLDVARTSLNNLLVRLELEPKFEINWQKEEYLVSEYGFQSTSQEKADFIRVGFNPAIEHYQLVSLDPKIPLIFLVLNKKKETVSFFYQVYFSSFEAKETYDLKTQKEVENLLVTEGRVIYSGTYQKTTKEPTFTQAEFNQITLAYYQDPEKDPIIQPIYILSGQGTLENGEKTEIIAYLPAIKFGIQNQENLEVPREFFQLPELP